MSYPRVTEIIRETLLPPDYYKYSDTTLGTYVHLSIQYRDENTLDYNSLDKKLVGYIQAYENWLDDYKPQIISSEKTFVHSILEYQGTPDKLVSIVNGLSETQFYVVDIKTGQPSRWHKIQLAAYRRLVMNDEEMDKRGFWGIANLYLSPKTYKFVIYDISDLINADKLFLSALEVYKFRKEMNNGN